MEEPADSGRCKSRWWSDIDSTACQGCANESFFKVMAADFPFCGAGEIDDEAYGWPARRRCKSVGKILLLVSTNDEAGSPVVEFFFSSGGIDLRFVFVDNVRW